MKELTSRCLFTRGCCILLDFSFHTEANRGGEGTWAQELENVAEGLSSACWDSVTIRKSYTFSGLQSPHLGAEPEIPLVPAR